MNHYILNAIGEPEQTDVLTWSMWSATTNRVVEKTQIDGSSVSTVFIGSGFGQRPLLWETMVFDGPLDGERFCYETRMQAVRGHLEMCDRVREGVRATPLMTRQIELE